MRPWRCALILLTLLAACDEGNSAVEADGGSACGPLDGGLQICNPECPSSWPDACNPPEACWDDLAEGRCNRCDELTGEWQLVYVESFCYPDAGPEPDAAP
jgi:hypothetical protein